MRMALTREHKLVRRHADGPHELFDLAADPRERRNLINDAGYRSVAAHLTGLIECYFDRYSSAGKSGLLGAELPQHNMTEAWRQ